ncbi:class I SAM-dependent methyltransferase [Sulfurisphaera javensis]|uniref:Class I SAM-dependent methyltransferase n=1 Tax=Sulfurisphaera javensis TaxID=2049879 RepID=A0AAT9GMM0_9CREN
MNEKEETKEAYEYIVHRRKPLLYLNFVKGKIVGDIGCGSGQNCLTLKNRKLFTVCLDIALRQLIEARKKGCEDLVQADMEFMPFRDNSFESLLYIASIHHLKDPLNAIKESYRCLKQGGDILVTVWLVQPKYFFRRFVKLESKINNKIVRRNYRLYLPWELKKFMEFSGFKTQKYFLYSVNSFLPNNALYYGIKEVNNNH